VADRQTSRQRLVYVEGEVAHFELDGHLYALVADAAEAPTPTCHQALPDGANVTSLPLNASP
jgi:hypothetical protein